MAKKITVLGATGNIGTALVHQLLGRGHQVTAVARASARLDALQAAGATTKAGDAHDVALLTEALRGADAAFLMIPPNVTSSDVLGHMQQIGEATAEAVRAAGLSKAVFLSSIGADQSAGTGPVLGLHYQEARLNAIESLTVAHLRPAYFMENLLPSIGMIQHMGINGSATRPDLQFPMIATKDIAAKAAELLTADTLENHSVHYLLGPRNYSLAEATAAVGQAIGRPELPYVPFSYEDAKGGMVQAGLSENMADLYIEMTRHMNEGGVMTSQARTEASTTPTTLEDFAREVFAPAFKGAMACVTA
ncbi:NAD(P)H-binding protein [Hymenobacter saemangeumensis]|uniref:NAD(P)H-binding protein n=1 Tax=Hymenobacter saemangeumensis TaxID=1084522 RepID=A0ABP8I5Q0_9BACT